MAAQVSSAEDSSAKILIGLVELALVKLRLDETDLVGLELQLLTVDSGFDIARHD